MNPKSAETLISAVSCGLSTNPSIEIIHKSPNFIVVNKPFDLIINSDDPDRQSAFKILQDTNPELINPKLKHGFYVLHRLDYATSGILVVPLTKKSVQKASKSLQNGTVTKYYLAILRGHCQEDEYNVTSSIGTDSRTDLKMVLSDSEFCVKPRNAETLISVISRGLYQGEPATKVLLNPKTGRRHQLRIHCHSIGHTIVGDYTYSDRQDTKPKRMYLHAYYIKIPNDVEDLEIHTGDDLEDGGYEAKEIVRQIDVIPKL